MPYWKKDTWRYSFFQAAQRLAYVVVIMFLIVGFASEVNALSKWLAFSIVIVILIWSVLMYFATWHVRKKSLSYTMEREQFLLKQRYFAITCGYAAGFLFAGILAY